MVASLAAKAVASQTPAVETVHLYWKKYTEDQISELRLKVKISIMKWGLGEKILFERKNTNLNQ